MSGEEGFVEALEVDGLILQQQMVEEDGSAFCELPHFDDATHLLIPDL